MRSQSATYAAGRSSGTQSLRPEKVRVVRQMSSANICGNRAQKSTRTETWPVRLPPKSDPRAELITPKFLLAIFRVGSARLV